MELEIELVLDVHAELGEGPLWDERRQCLWFVDIMQGRVHQFDPISGADRVIDIGEPVGAIALSSRGDAIIPTHTGFYRLDLDSGVKTRIASVEADRADNRMNDGYVDPRGRFWAGTMSMSGRRHGSLYRLDPDGRVWQTLTGLTVSNGLDWSPDGRRMYFVDTVTGGVDLFDFDMDTGMMSNPRVFAAIPPAAGFPDGLIVDAEGFVWVALWAGGALHRYAPDGTLDRVVKVPVTHPTKAAFGGPDLSDLYITTAWIELTPKARAAQPHAGGLYRCRPGVRGQPVTLFGG
jgi:sugar lactone lactonase YvrE